MRIFEIFYFEVFELIICKMNCIDWEVKYLERELSQSLMSGFYGNGKLARIPAITVICALLIYFHQKNTNNIPAVEAETFSDRTFQVYFTL